MTAARTITLCGRQIDRPGHICAFFDSREQQYDTLVPYYKEGLAQGEQVITIVDAECRDDHCAELQQRGIAVHDAIAADQLKVLTSEDTYTQGGHFNAQRMYEHVQGALVAASWSKKRVRVSGVMDWANRGHPGSGELADYESRVNAFVPIYDCTLLCVYNIDELDGRTMMDVLRAHPYVIEGGAVRENPFYAAPTAFLQHVMQQHPPLYRTRDES